MDILVLCQHKALAEVSIEELLVLIKVVHDTQELELEEFVKG